MATFQKPTKFSGHAYATPNATLATALTQGVAVTSLAVTALVTGVASGASVVLVSGVQTQTFVASASAAVGATAISVTSEVADFSYPTGTLVDPPTFSVVGPASMAKSITIQNNDANSNLYVCYDSAGSEPMYTVAPGQLWESPIVSNKDFWNSPVWARWDGTPTGDAIVTVVL